MWLVRKPHLPLACPAALPLCRDQPQLAVFTGLWQHEVLCPADTLAAAGVAYHLADILLPELQKMARESGQAPDAAALSTLLEPFCQALAVARAPAMVHRVQQGLFLPLLEEVQQPSEGDVLQHLDIQQLAGHLFDLGESYVASPRSAPCI